MPELSEDRSPSIRNGSVASQNGELVTARVGTKVGAAEVQCETLIPEEGVGFA